MNKLIALILSATLAACAAVSDGQTIQVYKLDGARQCEGAGISVQEMQKELSGTFGVPPTVTLIDGLSLEAMRTVDESLVSFENLVARKDIDSASNRLLEAFGIGEYLPRVRRLPMTEKTKVLDFVRKKNKLLGFLEMKDYAEAEKTVMELKGEA